MNMHGVPASCAQCGAPAQWPWPPHRRYCDDQCKAAARRARGRRRTSTRVMHEQKRRTRKRGMAVVAVAPADAPCGRCGKPIEGDMNWGHEPPLKWCEDNGITECILRPEHPPCNQRDKTLPDHLRSWGTGTLTA